MRLEGWVGKGQNCLINGFAPLFCFSRSLTGTGRGLIIRYTQNGNALIPPQDMADLISLIKNWRYLDDSPIMPGPAR